MVGSEDVVARHIDKILFVVTPRIWLDFVYLPVPLPS